MMLRMRMMMLLMRMMRYNYDDDDTLTKFLNSHPCVAVDWIESFVHLETNIVLHMIVIIIIMIIIMLMISMITKKTFDQNLNLQ